VRRLLSVLALTLALPALVHAAGNPVALAAERTAAAKSVSFALTSVTTVPGRGRTTMTGSGVQRGTSARMTVRMRAQGAALRFDAVLLDERGSYVMYMRSRAFRSQLPAGKSWVRIDLSRQAGLVGVDFAALLSAAQTSAPLERGLVSTTRVRREQVAGRATTRYRAVLDVQRAARAVPSYGKQVAAIEKATGIRFGRIPYHVWVGGDGRLRRVRFSMATAVAGVRGTTAQTMTFLDYDRPVRISAPPRSQVHTP